MLLSGKFECLVTNDANDPTKDAWVNNSDSTRVELGLTSNNLPRAVGAEVVVKDDGKVGIGTADPKSKLHVIGLPVFVDNAAALAGGLTVGAFYHAGDGIVRVVF